MRTLFTLFLSLLLFPALAQIEVHPGNRYLQNGDGTPFFWLGDTCWELFHRMTREDTETFLDVRKDQGFNVIQAVALAEEDGLHTPNRYGDFPLLDDDPARLAVTPGSNPANAAEYDYWDHVDWVVKEAAERGLYIGLLPTWGDKVAHLWGLGPRVFNADNARTYGKALGERYRDHWNIIWILGGDRPAVYQGNDGKQYDDRPIWRAMAEGIKEGEEGKVHFMTYHTSGGSNSTSQFIHNEKWLQMNSFQSSHGARETPAWDWAKRDLAMDPPKPTIDMEPCYEDHPVNPWDGKWTRERGYFNDYDVRARIYRGVFAGTAGVTYGHHQIWQFLDPELYEPVNIGDTIITWRKAMKADGAYQMQHLKKLMLSRPYFSRIPDQEIILSDKGTDYSDLLAATRSEDGSYAMIYLPQPKAVRVDMSKLIGDSKRAWWFDPATGKAFEAEVGAHIGAATFAPPAGGKDWVLVVDDASRNFPSPAAE